jgi:cytochrome c-type biogenesis protein CcmE
MFRWSIKASCRIYLRRDRGCVAQGRVGDDGVFYADQVLAKHDENYMPPEAGQALDNAKAGNTLVDK